MAADVSLQEGQTMVTQGGSSLMHSFSLPGESQKAAHILRGFLGEYCHVMYSYGDYPAVELRTCFEDYDADSILIYVADPAHPATALNSIPKAVLQRAKGK